MLLALALSVAHADTILLDTGAAIDGDLARYEFGGDCQISVTEGGLTGAIVIVPCHRIESFVRTSNRTPVPIGVEEPPAAEPAAPLELHADPPVAMEEPADRDEEPADLDEAVAAPVETRADLPSPTTTVREEPLYEDEPIIPEDPIRAPEIAPKVTPPAPLTTTGPVDTPTITRSVTF